MRNFTTMLNHKTMETMKQLSFTRLLFSFFVLITAFTAQQTQAQAITFTGNTTDFTTPGITALAAGTGAVTYYASTDGTYMYFGAFRTGGNTWGSTDHFTVYVDADPRSAPTTAGNGSTTGLAWDNQTPTMPFRADYRIAIRTDGATGSGSGSSFYHSNNTTGGTANWSATTAANAKGYTQYVSNGANGGMEIRVPLSDFGNPASTYISMYSSYSGGGGGFFGPATGTFTGSSLSGYLRNLGVYKTTGNLTAGTATTPITDATVLSTAGDYGDITLSGVTTFALVGNTSYSGSLTMGSGTTNATRIGLGTFALYAGGRGFGGTAGQLVVNGSSGAPFTTGTGGTFAFLGAGLISGANTTSLSIFPSGSTVTIGGAVDFGNVGGATKSGLTGTLQINANGSINTNPPTYISGATLVYNTGGTYTAGLEWTTNSATAKGVPQAVTLQNNTAVNFGASALYRQANGLVTIGSGSGLTLSSASGGDLRIAGGLTNNNAATNTGLNTNGRALQTMNASTTNYTKNGVTGGTDSLDYLIIGSTGQFSIANNTNLNLTNASGSCLQWNSTGAIFLVGTNTISIVAGGTVGGTSSGSLGGTSATTSLLNLLGTCTWNTGGVISVSINVGIRVNLGLTISTAGRLSAGYLQINPGGFIGGTNPVVYPASGTLVYNQSSGTYGVQALEFPSTSGPTNLIINANGGTGISFANNNIGARTLTGTLTLNHDLDLSGTGTPSLTTLNTIANATATVKGSGAFTHSASGSFTTANASGINGTLTTSGTKTLPTTTSFTFNGSASQVTGTLLPATVAALTINNTAGGTNGVTISNNALTISGVTTLTAGALILPTAGGNLVTFTGNISTPTGGGTLTGSTTSNISIGGTIAGTSNSLTFTSGGASINNWTYTLSSNFGSISGGVNSVVSIYGAFQATGISPFIYVGASGGFVFKSGSSYIDNGSATGTKFIQTTATGGSFTIESGATFTTANATGLAASGANGAVQTTNRTYSPGANYTFASTAAQGIGNALDSTGDGTSATGKTGPITGSVILNNSSASGVTLNAGTTLTVNSTGTLTIGTATAAATVTAPATSVINGTGAVIMLGNGASTGSTLITAHASGVSGTIQTSGSNSLTNGANNNTNFTFNGSATQVTGSLLPATVNNLNFSNTLTGSAASPSITLSSSVTVNGTTTFAGGAAPLGIVSIGAGNTLTVNGVITNTNANKLVGTASSNLIIGGTGTIPGTAVFATSGGLLNNFTMNRTGQTLLIGQPLTVSGTFSTTAGVVSVAANALTLNGPIAFGAATLTTTGSLTIGGSGTITGNLVGTSNPLALNAITMNRTGASLNLGSNTTVSNATGLTLTAGNIVLGTFNLTNTNTAGTLGTGSSASMVVATSTGKAFVSIPTTSLIPQTFPIGDGTNYTPATLTFTNNIASGTVGASVTASAHPSYNNSGAQTHYLSRYWSFTTTGLTTYTYDSSYTYVPADINGTEGSIKLNRWNGSLWNESAGSTASSNVLTAPTALTQITGLLSGNDFTGRLEIGATDYVWNGSTSNEWTTPANWTPSGIPAALDNVTIDVTGSNVNCSINSGTVSVANFTLNGTGAFNMASGTALNISGNLTYGGSATASLDCTSTLNITNTASQNIPALNYGNLNLTGGARVLASSGTTGICGTLTPGAGAITVTGSTIDFNGSGAQTIPAFNYNNLTSSSTGARTLANTGTIGVASTFTTGTNSYTNTGSTIDFNGTGTQTVPVFPNFNNLTISGARGSATVTLASGTIGVAGTFNPSATAVVYSATGNTFDYTGTGAQTIAGFNKYNNLSNSGNGARTLANTPSIVIDGTYTPTTAAVTVGTSTIDFSNTGVQTMPATFYYNVTNSGNGDRTWASSGTIDINAGFTPTTATNTITGSTLTYSSTAATTYTMGSFTTNIANRQYNNLILVGGASSIWQLGSGFNLGVAGDFSLTGLGTLNVCANATANTMTVDGNFTLGTSSGKVNIASSSGAGTLNVTGTLTQNGTGILTVSANSGIGALNVTGNVTLSSSTTLRIANNASSPNTVVNFSGNLNTSGTSSILFEATSSTSGSSIINLSGNFTTTSTSANIVDLGATTYTGNEFRIGGDFDKSGTGTFNVTSASNLAGGFVFNKAGTQTFSYAGTNSNWFSYKVNSGSTLIMSTSLTLGANTNPYSNFTVLSGGTIDMGATSVISGGSATANASNTGFTLASGATMKTANATGVAGSITDLTKNLSSGANYEFQGAATGAFTTTPTTLTVNNFTVNKSSGDVKLSQSFTVNGNLAMTSGNLDLNGSFNVTLGAAASIVSESNTARVINSGSPSASNGWIGVISRTLGANPGNVANLGMNISVATAMGNTTIKRFPKIVSSIPTGLSSISRIYSIAPTTASTSSTFTLSYFDGELNSKTESAPNMVTYSSVGGGNETLASNYLYAGVTATDASANTITNTANLTTANTFWTALNTDKNITVQAGDWNTASTWASGVVPAASAVVEIVHPITVNATVSNAPSTATISTGGSVTFGASGALTVNTTLTNGGSGISMSSGGTLTMASGATLANGTNTFTAGTGVVAFSGTGTVTGTIVFNNVTLAGGVNFGTTATINGNLTINGGGYISSNPPFYGSASTLIYNSTGTYGRGLEWSATTGAGYPNNVTIQNNTTLDLGNGGTATARQCLGSLTVTSGSTFTMNNGANIMTQAVTVKGDVNNNSGGTITLSSSIGGDIKVEGNINDSGTFNFNSRAVFFQGSNTQDIQGSGTFDIPFVRISKSGGSVRLLTDLTCIGVNGANSLEISGTSSILDLNGHVLNLGATSNSSTYNSGITPAGYIKGSASSTLTVLGTGDLGTLQFDPTTPGTTNLIGTLNLNRTSGGFALGNDLEVSGTLTLTAGTINLGANNLTIGASGSIAVSSPDASKMIIANGAGELRKTFSTTGSFTFPIGDNTSTAEYSPATLNFTSGTMAGYAGVKLSNSKHSNNASTTDYINRFWTVSTSGITSPVCVASFTYTDADIAGTEANLHGGYYASSAWNCMGVVTTATNTISDTVTAFGAVTAGDYTNVGCCINPTAGGSITDDQTICSGTAPAAFTSTALPTGQNATLEYVWQSSTTSSSAGFADIASSNTEAFTPVATLTQTTWFKRLSRVTCVASWTGAAESNVVQVTVLTSEGGAVTGGSAICSGATSDVLTLAGHTGSVVRWEYAVSPFTSWTTISNTMDTYTSGALTETTQFRAVVQNGSCSEANATYTTVTLSSTTWDGTAWSNSAPNSTTAAIIAGNYNESANISACSLTVTSGTVVIPSGFNVTLNSALTVSGGTFTLSNNANLIQNTDDANSGAITVNRDTSMRRLDYTYWSSPVASQNLLAFSPQTLTNRFFTFNESSNLFVAVADPSATNFDVAKGYIIRASNFLPPNGDIVTVNSSFAGVPNNGTKTIAVGYSGTNHGYNLIGNPYPSTIDANAFLNYSGNAGTICFWTHYVQQAGSSNYAYFNFSGGTAGANGITPNGTIQVGQGFIYTKTASGTATFTNAMRVGNNSNQFFRNSAPGKERHRIWLNLSSSTTVYNQTLVGYIEGATQGIDAGIDGTILETGTTISSRINNENYVIQGRALPFDASDVVPLSFNAATADSYSLSIDHVDGLFSGSQTVYLKDNLLGTTHDIKANPYTFTSDAGTFNNRFEIVYTSSPLAVHTPTFDANSVIVYKQNEAISINAGATVMASIKVFDIRGRLLFENKAVNATTTTIKNLKAEQQMLLVQITSNDASVVTKKILY